LRELIAAVVIGTPFLVGASVAPDRDGQVVCHFADPEIIESSGLVVADGLAVTVNDSGDSARIFTVDLDTCRTVGVTRWSGSAQDDEALAPAGRGSVWVGDIGDNGRSRPSVTVTRVPYARSDATVEGEAFELTYPDGPADAEALLSNPVTGRLYVVSKVAFGGTVFEAPSSLSTSASNRLRPIGDAPGLVTDGSFFPDGKHLILRNYGVATVFTFPGLEEVGSFELPAQQQGEGIAVAPDGRVYASSEGVRSPLLRIALPEDVRRVVTPSSSPSASSSGSPSSAPSSDGPPGGSDTGSNTEEDTDPDVMPWVIGGLVALLGLGVLIRALRPS
jgi:hypothetical protein